MVFVNITVRHVVLLPVMEHATIKKTHTYIHTYIVEGQQVTGTDNWHCITKMIKRIFEVW